MDRSDGIKIFTEFVYPGEQKIIEVTVAQLHTMTPLKIPIFVNRSTTPGPVVMFSSGMHGDEINGIDIVRELIAQNINIPKIGTIICVPLINILSFINKSRVFPDGRDLNRQFPGSADGSLASRFAYFITKEIIPIVDYVVDFHTGGGKRFNVAQIRVAPDQPELMDLASEFNAPFTVMTQNIEGSFRSICKENGVKMLLFEGGMSLNLNQEITNIGVEGSKRLLQHLGMASDHVIPSAPTYTNKIIHKTTWLRTNHSGLFKTFVEVGEYISIGQKIATVYDPFGQYEYDEIAKKEGYLINVNHTSLVYQGDAIFNISKEHKHE